MIRANNNVCVEFDTGRDMVISETACQWGFKYKSVIGLGRAVIIDNLDEKKKALDIIMAQYTNIAYQYADERVNEVLIVKIEFDSLTGKKSG
jgi:hypothetical protein